MFLCGFLSSIVANDLKFYPLRDDPLYAVFPEGHQLASKPSVTLPQLFQYPLIIETPACCRTLGLAFSKTASSVVSQTLLKYLQNKHTIKKKHGRP